MLFFFALSSAAAAILLYVAVGMPALPTLSDLFFVLVLFFIYLILAIWAGYRFFFFSNDWYRLGPERQQRWESRHPRLAMLGFVCSAAYIICRIAIQIHRHHWL